MYDASVLEKAANNLKSLLGVDITRINVFYNTNNELCLVTDEGTSINSELTLMYDKTQGKCVGICYSSPASKIKGGTVYKISSTGTLTKVQDYTASSTFKTYLPMTNIKTIVGCYYLPNNSLTIKARVCTISNGSSDISFTCDHKYYYSSYVLAQTQFNATTDYVYNEKIFYGRKGIAEGTLGTPDNSFADVSAQICYMAKNVYDNMEPRVLTDDDKSIDTKIYFIPENINGEVLLDTSQLTDMTYLFQNCKNLKSIKNLDTSSATTMHNMCNGCSSLEEFINVDTSKAPSLSQFFYNCSSLKRIEGFSTDSTTGVSINGLFAYCESLVDFPIINVSGCTSTYYLFRGCKSMTVAQSLDTKNVTNMISMFEGCTNLTTIPVYDTSAATSMQYIVRDCPNLSDTTLNNLLTMFANATNINNSTLSNCGLTEAQATKCTTLSGWAACSAKGWTTGY